MTMANREKVIEGLEKVWDAFNHMEHELYADYVFDALALLKEDQHQIWEMQELNEYLQDKLKEQEVKPLRCKECSYHRNDGWCNEHRREVKESDYCSFGAWEGR